MNKTHSLHSLRVFLALGATAAASMVSTQAQGIIPSATLAGVPGSGNTYDYTLTLNNGISATTAIEGFWYAWIPGHFFLPTMPSSASGGTSGWAASVVGDSIKYQGNSTDALAPGQSAIFTFVSIDTPATLAGNAQGFPIGDSVAYPGTINFSGSSPNAEFVVTSVPEPSKLALLGGGLFCLVALGWPKYQNRLPGFRRQSPTWQ